MPVQQTSIDALAAIIDKLPASRRAVFVVIENFGPLTNIEIAERLGWTINCVTPRTNELVEAGMVAAVGKRLIGKNPSLLWGVTGRFSEMPERLTRAEILERDLGAAKTEIEALRAENASLRTDLAALSGRRQAELFPAHSIREILGNGQLTTDNGQRKS